MENYGDYNKERLTGHHETAHWSKFSWGIMTVAQVLEFQEKQN